MSERLRLFHKKPKETVAPAPAFDSIGIIGANGQTGTMLMETISRDFADMPITGIVRQIDQRTNRFPTVTFSDNITAVLKQDNPPQALILATPNPVDDTLRTIADSLTDEIPLLTLILPQNGVEVARKAQDALKGKNVTLIRASLFTPVSSENNGIRYNPDKLRIGLSIIPDAKSDVFDANKDVALQKARSLFSRAGFDTKIFEDYQSMEWTKLVLNAVVSSGAITGLTPKQTLDDSDLYNLEMEAIADRLQILQAAGITYANIPWGGANFLPLLDRSPVRGLRNRKPLRAYIKHKIVSGRENKQSGAWLNIMAGKPTELTYYHQPFITLAAKYRAPRSIVDEEILEIAKMHESGEIDLRTDTPEVRKARLFMSYVAQKLFTHKK